jgi:hypothetical protein
MKISNMQISPISWENYQKHNKMGKDISICVIGEEIKMEGEVRKNCSFTVIIQDRRLKQRLIRGKS